MSSSVVKWLFLSHAFIFVSSMSEVWVELRAPRFVVHGHSAQVRCEHNVDPGTIYKVVFFKNSHRIMQYVRGRDPPYEFYNFSGADINLIKVTPTSLTLDRMDFNAAGTYACEIAMEIPLYSKLSKIHEVNVIVRQKHRPKIRIRQQKLSPNGDLEATCHSSAAYPAPHLTWLVNNVKVDERLTIPHGTVNVHRYHHGMPLSLTNSSLRFPLSSLQHPNQTVDITCLSTIPSYPTVGEGYADVQNQTITVNLVRLEPSPTQLPVKILSSEENKSERLKIYNYLIFIMIVIIY
ncbi:uncharacterized protein LOC125052413 [Pieris napi]|uniref:uncharacterized protein LOC125052413 n=1 Tax=Pieris napi TaxID=78633 RepID=UPI001FB96C44|nr:uncharacterized protein LOC125052413 [Pieris napi]